MSEKNQTLWGQYNLWLKENGLEITPKSYADFLWYYTTRNNRFNKISFSTRPAIQISSDVMIKVEL